MKTFTLNTLALLAALASTGALAQPQPLGRSPVAPSLPPGLYVSVMDGQISLANRGGTTNFTAGQFGYTASPLTVPAPIPANPGLKFTPPPTFSQSSAPSGNASGKAAAVDCEVR